MLNYFNSARTKFHRINDEYNMVDLNPELSLSTNIYQADELRSNCKNTLCKLATNECGKLTSDITI